MRDSHRRQWGNGRSLHRIGAAAGAALLALASVSSLLSSRVRAAGIEHPDVGTVAIGRGGANAAAPSDGVAMFYNPAGLATQRGVRVTLDASMSWQGLTFAPPGGTEVANSAGGFLVPVVAASYGLGPLGPLPGLTVALGATGPSAIGKETFPNDGPQRYALRSSDYFIAYYSASVAAQINRWISAGVTFQLVHGTAKFSQAVWAGLAAGTDPTQDAIANIDVANGWFSTPTAVLGVNARPIPPLAVGLSFRPGFDFNAHGTLVTQIPEAQAQALNIMVMGNATDFSVSFPDVIRLGAQYAFGTRWLVEADVVAERWSRLRTIEIHPKGITVSSSLVTQPVPLENIIFEKNFHTAYSARVGADFAALPGRLTVRAGYLHETSAIPTSGVSVDFGNWQRDAISAGATVKLWGGISLSAAFAHHFLADQNVSDSKVKQIISPCVTFDGCRPPEPSIVGNGRYTGSLDVASLALGFVLDELNAKP